MPLFLQNFDQLGEYFFLSLFLWVFSFFALSFLRKNILMLLIGLELLSLSLNLLFLGSCLYLDDILGQIFSLILLTVAAAEAAIGLAFLVAIDRHKGRIFLTSLQYLKG